MGTGLLEMNPLRLPGPAFEETVHDSDDFLRLLVTRIVTDVRDRDELCVRERLSQLVLGFRGSTSLRPPMM